MHPPLPENLSERSSCCQYLLTYFVTSPVVGPLQYQAIILVLQVVFNKSIGIERRENVCDCRVIGIYWNWRLYFYYVTVCLLLCIYSIYQVVQNFESRSPTELPVFKGDIVEVQ